MHPGQAPAQAVKAHLQRNLSKTQGEGVARQNWL
jgi:hypothetical protein